MKQTTFYLCLLLTGIMQLGCFNTRPTAPLYQAPVVFNQPPTLDTLISHVNNNTARVQSLEANGASLSTQGYPSIRASISMAAPKNFRLIGETSFTGQLIDLGSNEQEFWAWSKIGNWPGQLYARHDQFQTTAARQMLPIEPSWIAQALGLVTFDPSEQHQGPFPTANGNYEIRSKINTPSGQMTKVTVIHQTYGWVLQQHVYDPAGQTLASAMASDHRYDPSIGVSMPHQVQISLPPAGLQFTIESYGYRYNHLSLQDNRWIRPQRNDVPSIDLANPNFNMNPTQPVNTQPVDSQPAAYPGTPPPTGYPGGQPNYPAAQPAYRQSFYDHSNLRGFKRR